MLPSAQEGTGPQDLVVQAFGFRAFIGKGDAGSLRVETKDLIADRTWLQVEKSQCCT